MGPYETLVILLLIEQWRTEDQNLTDDLNQRSAILSYYFAAMNSFMDKTMN